MNRRPGLDLRDIMNKAKNGDAESQTELARMYEEGNGVKQSDAEAIKWYTLAAEQGDKVAQNNLAVFYEMGIGVEKDEKKAFDLYLKSAEQGYADAQFNAGSALLGGRGVEESVEESFKWMLKAAEQNHPYAMCNIGAAYDIGCGIEKDVAKAFEWTEKSAAIYGIALAQYNLGMMYEAGRGTEKNAEHAITCITESAKQRCPFAQFEIGRLYQTGEYGLERSKKMAERYYRMAEGGKILEQIEEGSAQGSHIEIFYKGWMYEWGVYVEKDLYVAREWYQKASDLGFSLADDRLRALEELI